MLPALATALTAALAADPSPLDLPGHIPLSAYEQPDVPAPQLSPDGSRYAWVRVEGDQEEIVIGRVDGSEPERTLHLDGMLNSWPLAHQATIWTHSGENWALWLIDVDTGARLPISRPGEKLGVIGADPRDPSALDLIRVARDRVVFERLDPSNGQRTELWRGRSHPRILADPSSGAYVAAVDDQVVRGDQTVDQWVRKETILALDGSKERPVMMVKNPYYVSFSVLRMLDAQRVAWLGAVDTDKASVGTVDLQTGKREILYEAQRADVGATLWLGSKLVAVREDAERRRWAVLDPAVGPDLARLGAALDGDFRIYPSTPEVWLVREDAPTRAMRWYAYTRATGALRRIGADDAAFDAVPWRPMQALAFPARDGLPLTAMLTTPDPARFGAPPYPVVVAVHGGPWWDRVEWSWDYVTQRYADLGYAVLGVNFRGSGGFGKAFGDASKGEWGGKMSTDLLDGLAYAAGTGQVDPTRAAIDGASYGGYAALAAMTLTPGSFRCGVALLPEGSLLRHSLFGAIDFQTLGSRSMRLDRSPDQHVDALQDPVLVLVGAHDRAVPWGQVAPFVRRARAAGKSVELVRDPKGQHGPTDQASVTAWTAVEEDFLAKCLGGDAPDVRAALAAHPLAITR